MNEKRLTPSFFLIGAPKCGTTALHSYLSGHPKIFLPTLTQEYFSKDLNIRSWHSLEDYMEGFPKQDTGYSVVGERSVWYLYSKEAVSNIVKFNPKAKFIVMLRSPLEMAPSLYREMLFDGHEHSSSFQEAWNAQEERKKVGKGVYREPKMLQYGDICKLGEQMQRLFAVVPQEQIKVLLLDDLKNDAKKVYEDVLEFLDVPSDGRKEFPIVNANKQPRSLAVHAVLHGVNHPIFRRLPAVLRNRKLKEFIAWISLKNTARSQKDSLSPKFRLQMREYFAKDILLLERILKRDLPAWKV
jgi:hypothetical protein